MKSKSPKKFLWRGSRKKEVINEDIEKEIELRGITYLLSWKKKELELQKVENKWKHKLDWPLHQRKKSVEKNKKTSQTVEKNWLTGFQK